MTRLAALLALLVATRAAGADCALEYRFDARWQAAEPRFEARLAFDAGERTETRVRISPEWGGVTDFHRGIANVRTEGDGASIAPDDGPNRWRLTHPRGARVVVRYDVVNAMPDVDGAGAMNHRDFYRNTLGATRFQVFGHGALVWPESLPDSEPVAACFEFSGLPAGWSFASNHQAGHRDGRASWRARISPQQVRASIFLGGDYRLHRRDIEGRPLWIALRGRWSFEDREFVDAAAKVVEAHRRFWNDFDFPHYLISLSPNRVPSGSTGGTGLDNAFAMHASADFAVRSRGFEHILAHEHLHTWVPGRLGTMGTDEAQRYWFSEGFTNYLTHRLLLRSGVWKLEDYVRALNEELRQYHVSPARDASNARVLADFWKDAAVQKIPYRRGEFFALHLAGRMAAKGRSLEATLRSLRLSAAQVPREMDGREADLAVSRFRSAVRSVLGEAAEADFAHYIEEGRPLPIGADFLGPCFSGKWVEKPVFELGFDPASLKARKLVGVVAGGPAERAGLRDGMELAGWSVHYGDADREAVVTVMQDGRARDVRYLPQSARRIPAPEFAVRPGAIEEAACKEWRAGG